MPLHPILLSGGTGSRLWPLSRQMAPKQFIPLLGKHSLLQETLLRLNGLTDCAKPICVANQDHRFLLAEQLWELNVDASIILEPCARNTAAAVALATFFAQEKDSNALLLVLPADHVIGDQAMFISAIETAQASVTEGRMVTFGVMPTEPHTGYGYIRAHQLLSDDIFAVDEFIEKPNREKAQSLIAAKTCFWNSGMFLFSAKDFLEALKTSLPDTYRVSHAAITHAKRDLDFLRPDAQLFAQCPDVSIDVGIMEKAKNIAMVKLKSPWSDVGAWDALFDLSKKDAQGNAVSGDTMALNCNNNYIQSNDKLLCCIGISNLIVVETADAVLICQRNASEQVKEIVARLKKDGRHEQQQHTTTHRPWGYKTELSSAEKHKVYRICIHPNQAIALQMHLSHHKHWVVLSGKGQIYHQNQLIEIKAQSTFSILPNEQHTLNNNGAEDLILLEILTGDDLSGQDIMRYDLPDTFDESHQ